MQFLLSARFGTSMDIQNKSDAFILYGSYIMLKTQQMKYEKATSNALKHLTEREHVQEEQTIQQQVITMSSCQSSNSSN